MSEFSVGNHSNPAHNAKAVPYFQISFIYYLTIQVWNGDDKVLINLLAILRSSNNSLSVLLSHASLDCLNPQNNSCIIVILQMGNWLT